jgi:hypothetical protein
MFYQSIFFYCFKFCKKKLSFFFVSLNYAPGPITLNAYFDFYKNEIGKLQILYFIKIFVK